MSHEDRHGRQPDQIADRWMRIKGIRKPHGHETASHAVPQPEFLGEAYDLIVQRDTLNSDRVREQRRQMGPDKKDTPLSLDEKKEMLRRGQVGSLISSVGKPEGAYQDIVERSVEKVTEIEERLDEIFSTPGMYDAFRSDLSHQVRVRRGAGEVRNLGRLTDQLSLLTMRLTRDAQVAGRALTSVEEDVVRDNAALANEAVQRQRELLKDPEVFDRMRILQLQEYQKQLKNEHFGVTPSRKAYIDKIAGYWSEGKKILGTGETGTGKTELFKYASRLLFKTNPESVTGHQDMSIYELLGKTGFKVQVGDVFRPAPMVRSMTGRDGRGMPFLFDELDRSPNQAVMGIKTLLNARPGEKGIKVQTDSEGSFDVGPDYAVAATGNIKSDKHTTATDLDPAIVRVFDAPMEIDYMPADEVYDLALASLMDNRGGVPLSETEAKDTLKHFIDAAADIQNVYQGRKLSSGKNLDARGGATTGTSASLKKALLDPGRTLDMLRGWPQARSKGEAFEEYLNQRIIEFINNRTYPEDDRYYVTEIFALKGFLKGHKPDELLVSGLTQRTLESWGAKGKPGEADHGYLSADRVAHLDPYKRLKRPAEQDAHDLLAPSGTGKTDEGDHERVDIAAAEHLFGNAFLGPEQVRQTFGIDIPESETPEIPFSQEELERAAELGQRLILRVDTAADGAPLTMKKMNEMLQAQFQSQGKGKILHKVDWYPNENFYKQETPKNRWALVSTDVIPESLNKNYLQQTQVLADYVRNDVFQGGSLPPEYEEALDELDQQKAGIAAIILSDWKTAAQRLSELKLNQLTRRTPAEAIYDLLMNIQGRNDRLLQGNYDWTISRSSDGSLVYVGDVGAGGAGLSGWGPDSRDSSLGVVLSR